VDIDKGKQYTLNHDDSLLVPKGCRYKSFLNVILSTFQVISN